MPTGTSFNAAQQHLTQSPVPYRPNSGNVPRWLNPANDNFGPPANDNTPIPRSLLRQGTAIPLRVIRNHILPFERYQQAIRIWNNLNEANRIIQQNPRQMVLHNYLKFENCGPGGTPREAAWPNCGAAYYVSDDAGFPPAGATVVYVWGAYVTRHPVVPFNAYEPGYAVIKDSAQQYHRWAMADAHPVGLPRPALQPWLLPTALPGQPVPIPRPFQPYVTQEGREVGPAAPARPGRWTADRPLRPRGEPHVNKKPEENTRERKIQVSPKVMWLLRRAHDLTEGLDFLDALYEALPPQYRTDRSGRTRLGARIGPNRPYATPMDKARSLYRNWDRVNVPAAMRNLAQNQIIDIVLGRANQGADAFSNRNLGGSRLVFS